ncbi:MAG TPA: elongation factor P maturation arginine rhamnosyltransferase EarP, partial [Burkholderiaceae bacterium]|nr:elongation factor P maturation arginine rhamnosyltransferase EarP [Burkholderiaceae bacterium]
MGWVWDLFCRVIDNHGDLGVCWRLAADLAGRGESVRLWVDDAAALAWMAPHGHAGVEVVAWQEPLAERAPGDVVIEAFGCELPEAHLRRMAQRAVPPVWINLEYLSAEGYVERSHGLPSPQSSGPAAGLRKWFFYPGFTARTGGLLREPGLMARRQAFDRDAWRVERGWAPRPGERVISLFCYEQPALATWLQRFAQQPTLLLATAGHAARQVEAALGPSLAMGALRARIVEPLPQLEYDHLLWASDLNIVRGEDSFVRAQWAGVPFVWH